MEPTEAEIELEKNRKIASNANNETPEKVKMKGDDINTRRRGAKLIDIFGKEEKRKRGISLGLSDLILPPITRKSVARYRSINTNVINPATGDEPDPTDCILPGTYKLYDWGEADFNKRWKIMTNTRGAGEITTDKVTGKQIIEDVIEPIIMFSGIKNIDPERNYREYIFMELHPLNRSHKKRDNSLTALFERVDIKTNKDSAFKQAEMDLAYQAEGEIMKMLKNDVIGFATSAGVVTMEGSQQRSLADIKNDLRMFARKDPKKFYSMANNVQAAIRLNVMDALSFGLIEYEMEKRRFMVPYTDEPIHVHLADEDPNDSLVQFLSLEENATLYNAILNLIGYWE